MSLNLTPERIGVRLDPIDLRRLNALLSHLQQRHPYATRTDAVKHALALAAGSIEPTDSEPSATSGEAE